MSEFIGWRVWRIFDWEQAVLGAAVFDHAWEGPVLSIPADDHAKIPTGAGYHAFRTELLQREYWSERMSALSPPHTFGYYGLSIASVMTTGLPEIDAPVATYTPRLDYRGILGWARGRVRLYGTVVEHEHGFRSSHAIIMSLGIDPAWPESFAAALSDRYQCEVTRWPRPEQSAEAADPAPSLGPIMGAAGLGLKNRSLVQRLFGGK